MTYYFPDLIAGIDVEAEQKRLQNATFASLEPAPAPETDARAKSEPSELERWRDERDQQSAAKNGADATATFEQILTKYPNEPRAIYGLGVASVLARNIDRAADLFESLVSHPANRQQDSAAATNDAANSRVVACVPRERIHDLEDDHDEAVAEYRAALAVDGAPEAARAAAQRGVDAAYKPPPRDAGNKPQKP